MAEQHRSHVTARAPREVRCGDGVKIPEQPPVFVRRIVERQRRTYAEAVLRSEASHRDMKRRIREEKLRATGDGAEQRARGMQASHIEVRSLVLEFGADFALLCRHARGNRATYERQQSRASHPAR